MISVLGWLGKKKSRRWTVENGRLTAHTQSRSRNRYAQRHCSQSGPGTQGSRTHTSAAPIPAKERPLSRSYHSYFGAHRDPGALKLNAVVGESGNLACMRCKLTPMSVHHAWCLEDALGNCAASLCMPMSRCL
jgi:hypothetical protein